MKQNLRPYNPVEAGIFSAPTRLSWKLIKLKIDYPFFCKMEEFLSKRRPSYKKVLHPPSVDREWNLKDAHECYIVTLLEKGNYPELYDFLKKKESYLELLKELDVLLEKYNLKIHPYHFESTDEDCTPIWRTREEYLSDCRGQTLCHYHDQLEHADKLIALDTWRGCLYNPENSRFTG